MLSQLLAVVVTAAAAAPLSKCPGFSGTLEWCCATYIDTPSAYIGKTWGEMPRKVQRQWAEHKCDHFQPMLEPERRRYQQQHRHHTKQQQHQPQAPNKQSAPAACQSLHGVGKTCCVMYLSHPTMQVKRTWGNLPVSLQRQWSSMKCDGLAHEVRDAREREHQSLHTKHPKPAHHPNQQPTPKPRPKKAPTPHPTKAPTPHPTKAPTPSQMHPSPTPTRRTKTMSLHTALGITCRGPVRACCDMYIPNPTAIVGLTLGSMSASEQATWKRLGCNSFARTLHRIRKQLHLCSTKECPTVDSKQRRQKHLDASQLRLTRVPAPPPPPPPAAPLADFNSSRRRQASRRKFVFARPQTSSPVTTHHHFMTAAAQAHGAKKRGSRHEQHVDKGGILVFDGLMVLVPLVACFALYRMKHPTSREQQYQAVELGESTFSDHPAESFVSAGYYADEAATPESTAENDNPFAAGGSNCAMYQGDTDTTGLPTI